MPVTGTLQTGTYIIQNLSSEKYLTLKEDRNQSPINGSGSIDSKCVKVCRNRLNKCSKNEISNHNRYSQWDITKNSNNTYTIHNSCYSCDYYAYVAHYAGDKYLVKSRKQKYNGNIDEIDIPGHYWRVDSLRFSDSRCADVSF